MEENDIWVVTTIDNSIATQIINDLGIQITKQNVINDISRGYTGMLGTVQCYNPH